MSEKLQKIIDVANHANHSEDVEIWTEAFKAKGKLFKENEKLVCGVVSLQNATVCQHECKCGHEDECNCERHEWLNIFEDKIISFTVFAKK